MEWYRDTVESVCRILETDAERGITPREAQARLAQYGANEIPPRYEHSLAWIFIQQFTNPLVFVLLIAGVIMYVVSQSDDAFIIAGVLLLNASIGTYQEHRARVIMHGLRLVLETTVVVLRDGQETLISERELVPGDIVLIKAGQMVPADGRLIAATGLRVDESLLTGESAALHKMPGTASHTLPPYEQTMMLFRGTSVTQGEGRYVVVATGTQTYVGTLNRLIESSLVQTPLQRDMQQLSHFIIITVALLTVGLFAIGLATGKSWVELLVTLAALFICVVPEGLPVILTLVLVSGAYRLSQKRVLVKSTAAAETLGRTDVLMIDKTGTLTHNQMMVYAIAVPGARYRVTGSGYHPEGEFVAEGEARPDALQCFLEAAYLLSSSELYWDEQRKRYVVRGSVTEAALGVAARKAGITEAAVAARWDTLADYPFSSAENVHIVVAKAREDSTQQLFFAGPPEVILELVAQVPSESAAALQDFLQQGLRGIGIATLSINTDLTGKEKQELLARARGKAELLGLCGLQDAVREDAAPLIERARRAGLRIIMATGDHQATARYVAEATGLATGSSEVMTGVALTDKEATVRALATTDVFARVTPRDKFMMIETLHELGNTVAMTGDGINDVPSLAAADVGIAMGSGTDSAKEAAGLVLLDDSFASVVAAIEEGRHIFYTLRRVVLYFFTTNLDEFFVILFSIVWAYPLPLGPAHILWLNLVTDGIMTSALAAESHEEGLLEQGWLATARRRGLVDRSMIFGILYMALPMAIGATGIFLWYLPDLPYARTMTLICMSFFQWFNAWNARSETKSLLQMPLLGNVWLIGASLLVVVLQMVIVYVPLFQRLFATVPVRGRDWMIALAVASLIIVIDEVRKWYVRRRRSYA